MVCNETRPVAILALGTKEDGESYTHEDEETAKAAFRGIGAIMEQAVLRERLRDREEDLATLNQLVNIVTYSSDVRDARLHLLKGVPSLEGTGDRLRFPFDWPLIGLPRNCVARCFSTARATAGPWTSGLTVWLAEL